MKLLLIVHKDDAALEGFFVAVREEHLTNFTIQRSQGFAGSNEKNPLEFGGMGALGALLGLHEEKMDHVTVMSVVQDERLPRVLALLQQHVTDLDKPGGGFYAVLPVESWGSLQ